LEASPPPGSLDTQGLGSTAALSPDTDFPLPQPPLLAFSLAWMGSQAGRAPWRLHSQKLTLCSLLAKGC
jgi:hypothetical protein